MQFFQNILKGSSCGCTKNKTHKHKRSKSKPSKSKSKSKRMMRGGYKSHPSTQHNLKIPRLSSLSVKKNKSRSRSASK